MAFLQFVQCEVIVESGKQAAAFEEIKTALKMDEHGRLILKGQEMVLLPRHFFRYILREVKDRAGQEVFDAIFYKAGFDGALTFCTRYREINGCSAHEAIEAYLGEMSARGWGAFDITRFVPDKGILEVTLKNSALVPEGDLPSGHLAWKGAMVGALRSLPAISDDVALTATIEETEDGCRITVQPE